MDASIVTDQQQTPREHLTRAEAEAAMTDTTAIAAAFLARTRSLELDDVEAICRALLDRDSKVQRLLELLKRPMEDSLVTTSDDPGCFFCDRSGKHLKSCKAAQETAP